MNVLIMTIPVSLTLGILFLLFFLSAAKDDQFENLDTSAQLPFSDDEEAGNNEELISEDIKKQDVSKKKKLETPADGSK